MVHTKNGSATYAGSSNPYLNFFFQVMTRMPAERVRGLLAAAWARDPIPALWLVANLRGVHGMGNSNG